MTHHDNSKRVAAKKRRKQSRLRFLGFEQCEERLLLSASPSDISAPDALLASPVEQFVRVSLETTDMSGQPISQARVGHHGINERIPFERVDFGRANMAILDARNIIGSTLPVSPARVGLAQPLGSAQPNSLPSFQPIEEIRRPRYESLATDMGSSSSPAASSINVTRESANVTTFADGGFVELDNLQRLEPSDLVRRVLEDGLHVQARPANIQNGSWYDVAAMRGNNTSELVKSSDGADFTLGSVPLNVTLKFYQSTPPRMLSAFSPGELPVLEPATPELASELSDQRIQAVPKRIDYATEIAARDQEEAEAAPQNAIPAVVAADTTVPDGGYIGLADLRRVDVPAQIAIRTATATRIAPADRGPTRNETVGVSYHAGQVVASPPTLLAWELQVDGSRGVSLTFEVADESQASRTAARNGVPGVNISPPIESSDSAASAQGPPAAEALPALSNANSVSFHVGDGVENVRDERRYYLAVSPFIMIVGGALLVTDQWQKLQPREKKLTGLQPD